MDIDRDIVYHLGTSTWLAWSIFPRFREAVSLCNGCCCSPETSTLSFISSNVPMHFPVTIAMQKLCLMMLFFFLKIKSFARDNSSSWKHVIFLMQSLRRSIVHCAFSPKYTSLSSKLFIAVLVRIAPGGEFKTRSMFHADTERSRVINRIGMKTHSPPRVQRFWLDLYPGKVLLVP